MVALSSAPSSVSLSFFSVLSPTSDWGPPQGCAPSLSIPSGQDRITSLAWSGFRGPQAP